MTNLQLIFGMTMTNLSMYLHFSCHILIHVLKNDTHASITVPSKVLIIEFKAAINSKYPICESDWATMDRMKLYFQKSDKCYCYCSRWNDPNWIFNVPDSQVAKWGGIHDKLESVYKSNGGICIIDSAFGKIDCEFLFKSSQDYLRSNKTDFLSAKKGIQTKQATTSMGQAAEWGMQSFQSSFPWVKDWFVYEEQEEWQLTLKMLTYLYNLRAKIVGINQIKITTFPTL